MYTTCNAPSAERCLAAEQPEFPCRTAPALQGEAAPAGRRAAQPLRTGAALGPDELAESLAAVELTIALHYVFRTPQDRLIWDGGQPTLAHRVLTARRPRLQAVRARPAAAVRADNKYNHFGVGHTGTAISAALGIASAAALKGESRRAVAIIGDRDLAAGMAFEALNHAGSHSASLLVILNDTGGSFAGGADALSEHFARAFSGPLYGQLRRGGKRMLRQMPTMRELARRSEKHLKGMVLPGMLFEEIGFNYTGPLDGHDIKALVRALQELQQQPGRQFLHVVTDRRATARGRRRPPWYVRGATPAAGRRVASPGIPRPPMPVCSTAG